jgi:serine/threonine-protein kinase RsbW
VPDRDAVKSRTVNHVLDSTVESVDSAVEAVLREAEQWWPNEEPLYQIGLSVRESMLNAVVHGNQYSPRKRVWLTISQTPERLVVAIADEGEGFDADSVPDSLVGENLLRPCGRGLLLIRKLMDEVRIRAREPEGTEVTLTKYVPGGPARCQ